jgi:hypothetical protein
VQVYFSLSLHFESVGVECAVGIFAYLGWTVWTLTLIWAEREVWTLIGIERGGWTLIGIEMEVEMEMDDFDFDFFVENVLGL